MSIAHRIAKVRFHLPASITLRGHRGQFGDAIHATRNGDRIQLFVTKDRPFSPRQAAINFIAQLGGEG